MGLQKPALIFISPRKEIGRLAPRKVVRGSSVPSQEEVQDLSQSPPGLPLHPVGVRHAVGF